MGVDGPHAEHELLGDRPARQSPHHEPQHLPLARRQRFGGQEVVRGSRARDHASVELPQRLHPLAHRRDSHQARRRQQRRDAPCLLLRGHAPEGGMRQHQRGHLEARQQRAEIAVPLDRGHREEVVGVQTGARVARECSHVFAARRPEGQPRPALGAALPVDAGRLDQRAPGRFRPPLASRDEGVLQRECDHSLRVASREGNRRHRRAADRVERYEVGAERIDDRREVVGSRLDRMVAHVAVRETGAARIDPDDPVIVHQRLVLVMRERHRPLAFEVAPLRRSEHDEWNAGRPAVARVGDAHAVRRCRVLDRPAHARRITHAPVLRRRPTRHRPLHARNRTVRYAPRSEALRGGEEQACPKTWISYSRI